MRSMALHGREAELLSPVLVNAVAGSDQGRVAPRSRIGVEPDPGSEPRRRAGQSRAAG